MGHPALSRRCAALQVVLEAAVKAGTTRGLQVSYTDLNKHIDDPLNRGGDSQAAAHIPSHSGQLLLPQDRSGSLRTMPLDVPGTLRDQPLDVSRGDAQ